MISFIKLIDGQTLVGSCTVETEFDITITNAVVVGIDYRRGQVEQKYYFKGMYCPFIESDAIDTVLEKRNIISFHSGLDSHLESQYNRYIEDWFRARTDFNELNVEEVEKVLEDTLDQIRAMNDLTANTIIH